jgi:hypothetical protein
MTKKLQYKNDYTKSQLQVVKFRILKNFHYNKCLLDHFIKYGSFLIFIFLIFLKIINSYSQNIAKMTKISITDPGRKVSYIKNV